MNDNYDIFISYRRKGGDKYARTIQQALAKDYDVFLDFDELEDGKFDQRIIDAINSSSVFLLILSKGALDRCVNEDDWVRLEILQAVESGCHIVPVTIIGDGFEDVPDCLPEKLRKAVSSHQFSRLDMESLFKESLAKLIKKRIVPFVQKEETKTGAEIHIETDADCDLYRFKTFVAHLKANEDNVIYLSPGKYKLDFVSTQISDVKCSKVYSLASDITCDFIEIALMKDVEEAIRKEKEDQKLKLIRIQREGKWGYIDKTRKVIIPCKWNGAFNFSEGLALVKDELWKYGYIDKTGKVVIPCKWKNACCFNEGLARVIDESGKWVYIDKKGKVVIPCKWHYASDFSDGLAEVKDESDKWGYIDKTGKIVIPCKWKDTRCFSEGLAKVKDESDKWGYIDKTGKIIIPYKWKDAYNFSEGLARVIDEFYKYGYMDKTGKVVIPCKWKNARCFNEGLAEVKDESDKWGYIDKTGKVVIPCKWKDTRCFSEGLARVKDESDKWGYIDKTGKIIIPCKWKDAYNFSEGLAEVKDESGKWIYIGKSGKIFSNVKDA